MTRRRLRRRHLLRLRRINPLLAYYTNGWARLGFVRVPGAYLMKLISLLVPLLLPFAVNAQDGAGLRNPWDFKKTVESLTGYSKRLASGPRSDPTSPVARCPGWIH